MLQKVGLICPQSENRLHTYMGYGYKKNIVYLTLKVSLIQQILHVQKNTYAQRTDYGLHKRSYSASAIYLKV